MLEETEHELQHTASLSESPNPGARPFANGAISVRPLALAYRVVAVALIATGLIRITGMFSGSPEWGSLLFYTVLSNLLCLVWMLLLIIRTVRDLRQEGHRGASTPSARWSGAVMMAITVTMLIYLVVLVPAAFQQPGDYELFSFTDNLIHIITPCLLIGDWLLFVRKGAFRWIDPLLWALIPYAYLVFGFAAGAAGVEFYPGQTYPYPFMNVGALGIGGTALWIAGLTVALVGVGYLYVAVDRALALIRTGSPGEPPFGPRRVP
ncbi:Pr6Pr family membrane protein [Microbacterium sp. LWH12-1.2]|uniref:Pr6Pr family membrane protein n=1 Tax=Microbacterium sp. LWH12-1.2 TaxID=3135259 RepID=UPI00341A4732